MKEENMKKLATRSVHSGEKTYEGSPHTPIFNSTTFAFNTTADLLDVVDGRKPGTLYTRYGMNPSLTSLEAKLADLEEAEGALVFASGMAAEAALFFAHGRQGIVCIGDAYGGTMELLGVQLKSLNIPVHFLLGSELDQLEKALVSGARLVFFETPTNPTLEILDIQAIANTAKKHNALTVVDSTFATPVNQNPLKHGADLVVHSATKYLGGHSDITAGTVIGPQTLLQELMPWRKNLGQTPSPETASLLARSIRSLVPRVRWQNESGGMIAAQLEKNPAIRRVYYPGLPSFPNHEIAARQMHGFGGMMTIEVNGSLKQTEKVADAFQIFKLAPSLGGAESLATQPVTTTHHGLTIEERVRRGISDSMIRLSIGLEDPADLLADIEQALRIGLS